MADRARCGHTPHGLAPLCGSAPAVSVVGFLAGGETLRVTPDEHADLFWGLLGGKSMLGSVTSVEIDLHPITKFHYGAWYFDGADSSHVLHAWQR